MPKRKINTQIEEVFMQIGMVEKNEPVPSR
jgi:hypothetical protein